MVISESVLLSSLVRVLVEAEEVEVASEVVVQVQSVHSEEDVDEDEDEIKAPPQSELSRKLRICESPVSISDEEVVPVVGLSYDGHELWG